MAITGILSPAATLACIPMVESGEGAEQVERPEVGGREGLGALAVLAGDDELEEVGEAEDGDQMVTAARLAQAATCLT